MIQPGFWVDPDGAAHIFPDEIIAYLQSLHPEAGFKYCREDYDMLVEAVREAFGDEKVDFIRHTREPEA
jgi:hypothetical protein